MRFDTIVIYIDWRYFILVLGITLVEAPGRRMQLQSVQQAKDTLIPVIRRYPRTTGFVICASGITAAVTAEPLAMFLGALQTGK